MPSSPFKQGKSGKKGHGASLENCENMTPPFCSESMGPMPLKKAQNENSSAALELGCKDLLGPARPKQLFGDATSAAANQANKKVVVPPLTALKKESAVLAKPAAA